MGYYLRLYLEKLARKIFDWLSILIRRFIGIISWLFFSEKIRYLVPREMLEY